MVTSQHNERVVIVGASSGIGRATAELLALQGYGVLAVGRDKAKLAELPDAIETAAADATDPEAIHKTYERFAPFHHLVLTASSSRGAGAFADLDLNDLRGGFEGKFWPFVHALQQAIPFLDAMGSVTLITAASSGDSIPGTAGLAAINGALEAMVPVLAVELAPRRINAVSPGVIDTPWWSAYPAQTRDAVFADFAKRTTLGRIGKPEEIAHAIRFLIENPYTTGNLLKLEGGARFT